LRHAPEPSHAPSLPHEAKPASVHWLMGSVPAGTNLHVPWLPPSAQDWQVPVQAVAQQVDWLQFPCTHSVPKVQAAPSDFLPHTPPLQVFGLTQSLLPAHIVRQIPVPMPHSNGVQVDCVPGWQTPAPLHRGAEVNVEPEQVVPPHVVPAA
jgi:hypothetical protein